MGPLGNSVKLIYRLEELAGVGGQHGGEEGSLKSGTSHFHLSEIYLTRLFL